MNDSFTLLNMMLGQWNRKRWLIYHLLDVSFTATGAPSYSIGPAGDLAYPYRPDRLEAAYVRIYQGPSAGGLRDFNTDFNLDFSPGIAAVSPGSAYAQAVATGASAAPAPAQTTSTGIDYPLEVIQSYEDYARIGFKSLGTFPQAIFYDPGFPLGTLRIWPVPSSRYEIHLILKDQLLQIPTITSPIALPNEYYEALFFNLIVRLFDLYAMPPRPISIGLAKAALNTIRNANAQVPLLEVPDALNRPGVYNVFSDTYS